MQSSICNHSHYGNSLSQRCSTCGAGGKGNDSNHKSKSSNGLSDCLLPNKSTAVSVSTSPTATATSTILTTSATGQIKYIYDLPYNVRKSLCDLLDADGSWRQLGGQFMGLNDTQLTLISHALLRNSSPTNDLLIRWEQTNGQVRHLFKYLHEMKHKRAMTVLSPYVDSKLRSICLKTTQDDEDGDLIKITTDQSSLGLLDGRISTGDYGINYNDYQTTKYGQGLLGAVGFNPNYLYHQNHHGLPVVSGTVQPRVSQPTAPTPSHSMEQKILNQCKWNNLSLSGAGRVANACNPIDQRGNIDCRPPLLLQVPIPGQNNLLIGKESKFSDKSTSAAQSDCSTLVQSVLEEELEVSYKELLLSTDDFSEDRIIGSGGFGIVYKGIWKGTEVAIKRLKSCDSLHQAKIELRALNQYRIDNILPLYAISLDGPEACLLYQYMPNGSLEDRLLCRNNTPPLTWSQRAIIGEGLAKALNFLHTLRGKPLVHGDVKSANVLLDSQYQCKLGDFGLARQIMSSTSKGIYTHLTVTSVHGTCVYLPPEYLRNKILSPAVDVYSYGIVMLEMATGRRAYDGKRLLLELVQEELAAGELDETRKGAIHLRDLRLGLSPETSDVSWFSNLLQLGLDCANKQKKKRPEMSQILEYYSQCKTRDRIRRLSAESSVNSSILDELKTPFQLQLWYDMTKKTSERSSEGQPSTSQPYPTGEGSNTNRSEVSSLPQTISSLGDDDSHHNESLKNHEIPLPLHGDTSSGIIPLITELGLNDESENGFTQSTDHKSASEQ